ncbi:hypothetical protein J7I93_15165 [Bacillus sp. ISL-47]|uniref:hypothetical protein n=1 Tax=Bacillus sp. ISL-47 TaxID=2819130 RepID=UPI001BE90EFE|nr:hypothetical protein [Bacillus sp. ISL-47]MBT2689530.1 hypothetical protein [Bacillus sp. ISL-47]MBT2708349.1 hypothetical protein [Pseudomonas sp. ISL-84]
MFIVKLYNQSADVLHIGRFSTLQEAEAGASRGLKYSSTAIVYDGEIPVMLFDHASYPEGFPLGTGNY